jgi:hypothetical protein
LFTVFPVSVLIVSLSVSSHSLILSSTILTHC